MKSPPTIDQENDQGHIHPPPQVAAGLTAVVNATRHAFRAAGVIGGTRALLQVNQVDGFDCQSCAWPSPTEDRHVFEFCENGAKAVADEATRLKVDREFFARYSVEELAARSDYWLNAQGRLVEPMVLRPGATHYSPIGWDEAFRLLATELNALPSPDAAAFYTSGRTSNEAAFLYQLFVRTFGTNNLPDCSNLCHESSGAALSASIGVGKGTVSLEDFDRADLIVVVGQNPGTNHPRMLSALESAKRKGARIVSINPLPEVGLQRFKNPQDFLHPGRALRTLAGEGTPLTDLWLQPRIGGDLALFKGVMKAMLEAEDRAPGTVLDRAFIDEQTTNFEALAADLRATEWTTIEAASGVTRSRMVELATLAAQSRATICCWAMGLTQQVEAVATIRQVVNFLLLRGNFGRPGAGACPVRGHSNVQGDRTMGISISMPEAWLARLEREFGVRAPRHRGLDTVATIQAMHEGGVRVLFALGGNFLSANPDTHYTEAALRRCAVTAHVSTKLNRAHLVTGRVGLILPCLGRSERDVQRGGEQFVTVEDSMGVVNPSRGRAAPAGPALLSEPAIVARLAAEVLRERSAVDWLSLIDHYDAIRDRISRVVPGFEDFNRRIREGAFVLPHPVRDAREWRTPGARAHFHPAEIVSEPLQPGEYLLMTIRTHDQFNTTVYGLDDRYRGVFGMRRVVFAHPDDLREAGLQPGEWVDLIGARGRTTGVAAERFMIAEFPIARGCLATYFPEANTLVPIDRTARISNTPASKSVVVRWKRSSAAASASVESRASSQ